MMIRVPGALPRAVMERTVGAEDFSESPLMLDDFVFGC
jgi:hypothetical protein